MLSTSKPAAKPRTIRAPHHIPRPTRRPVRWPWVRLGFMAIAALALFGLGADLVSLRLKADKALSNTDGSSLVADALVEVSTATARYTDPAGRFSVAQPPSWAAYPFRKEGDYDVTLRGPHRMEIAIMTKAVGPAGFAAVRGTLEQAEERLRINTHIERVEFQGRPAFKRFLPLGTLSIETRDFAVGPVHIHIAASAPHSSFEALQPVLLAMMESFRPGGEEPAGDETIPDPPE